MKKRKSGIIITLIILCIVIVVCLYTIDLSRMKNNQPVIFSTWRHSYIPPVINQEPPVLKLENVSGELKATCLTSTYSWKNGDAVLVADFPHPANREYSEDNILKTFDRKDRVEEIFIDNPNAKIKDVNLYKFQIPGVLKYHVEHTENSVYIDMPDDGEYVLEIITEYDQGTVAYCVKVIVQN